MSQKSCTLLRNGTCKNLNQYTLWSQHIKGKAAIWNGYLEWHFYFSISLTFSYNLHLSSTRVIFIFSTILFHMSGYPRDGFDYCNLIMLCEPYSSLLLPIILLQISYCAENAINHIRLCQKLGLMQNHSFIRRNLGESGLQTSSMTK